MIHIFRNILINAILTKARQKTYPLDIFMGFLKVSQCKDEIRNDFNFSLTLT